MSLLFISRPYSRQDASKTVQKLEFNTAVKSQERVLPATTKKGSSYKKPAVPPKPRNVVVKQRSSTKLRKSGEILSKKTNVLLQDEKSEQNDSGLSGKLISKAILYKSRLELCISIRLVKKGFEAF